MKCWPPWANCGAAPTCSLSFSRAPKAAPISTTATASWKSIAAPTQRLTNALMLLQTELSRVPERPEEINNLMRRAQELRATL